MVQSTDKNPIQLLRQKTPDFVWNWYEEKFRDAVKEYTNGEFNSEYKSFTGTLVKYRDGIRGSRSLVRVNIFWRRIIEQQFPILHPDKFFIGSEAEQKQEALETAERMVKIYKKELHRQTAEIIGENENL